MTAACGPLLLAVRLATASAPVGQASEATLLWQSVSATPQTIPRDLAILYETLHRASRLPTRPYIDLEGRAVERVLRDEGLFFGAYFPVEADRVLCKLNRPVCRLTSDDQRPVWSNRAGDTLQLPGLRFDRIRVSQEYPKKMHERVERIVRMREGCERYDASCWEKVEAYNDESIDALNRRSGPVVIPALTIRTTLPVTLSNLPLDARIALIPNLPAIARIREESGHVVINDPLFAQQRDVFELIRHPFATGASMPDCTAINVAVIDNDFDTTHCDFTDNAPDAECGKDGGEGRRGDHGTHVAGIIGARANGRAVVGMSPGVSLYSEKYVSLPGNTSDLSRVIDKLRASHRIKVFNLSFGYPPDGASASPDLVETAIQNFRRNSLFVAAAGNDGKDKSGVCDVRPACIRASNVLSVIAINRQPEPALWAAGSEKSNWGQVFDIAAPGENVLSTVKGGGVAKMSGTSQATPMVAAAAALLFALDESYRPLQVRRRLIATSDLDPKIDGAVLGGRLNVQRAIEDREEDVFELHDGEVVKGELADDEQVVRILREDGSSEPLKASRILRWKCTSDNECTFLFVEKDADRPLFKLKGAAVQAETKPVRVRTSAGIRKLTPLAIRDFRAAIRTVGDETH